VSKTIFSQEADTGCSQDSGNMATIQSAAEISLFAASHYYHSGKNVSWAAFGIVISTACEIH